MICKARTTQFCKTCYPMGNEEGNGAVCGPGSGRDCLHKHEARVLLNL